MGARPSCSPLPRSDHAPWSRPCTALAGRLRQRVVTHALFGSNIDDAPRGGARSTLRRCWTRRRRRSRSGKTASTSTSSPRTSPSRPGSPSTSRRYSSPPTMRGASTPRSPRATSGSWSRPAKHHNSALCHITTTLPTRGERYLSRNCDGRPVSVAEGTSIAAERYSVPAEVRPAAPRPARRHAHGDGLPQSGVARRSGAGSSAAYVESFNGRLQTGSGPSSSSTA